MGRRANARAPRSPIRHARNAATEAPHSPPCASLPPPHARAGELRDDQRRPRDLRGAAKHDQVPHAVQDQIDLQPAVPA